MKKGTRNTLVEWGIISAVVGSVWTAVIAVRGMIVTEAKAQTDSVRKEFQVHLTNIDTSLSKIEGKLDDVLEIKYKLKHETNKGQKP